jgi:chorismate mutase/prephenate dehydrogenase
VSELAGAGGPRQQEVAMSGTTDRSGTGGDPKTHLERHRRDIEALDRRILHLVCERLAVARQIGELKNQLGVPLRNFRVERQVLDRFEEASSFLGLDALLGHDLALFLIQKAVEEQATLRDVQYTGDSLDTLVVGGKGGMGRWIARFLAGQGHRVRILDPATATTEFSEESDVDAARDADLVMVAVPMSACAGVLEELANAEPRGVIAEMCSLKSHLAPVLDRLRRAGVRVVSFHPMFGPDVRMLSDRTIVFCSDGRPEDVALVRGLFEETSANLVEMEVADHDRRMAAVLGLTHLANLVYARALSCSGLTAERLVEVAGVTFQKQIATTLEVVAENPGLYYEIQALNPATPEIAEWLRDSIDRWQHAIEDRDPIAFERLMSECRSSMAGI